MSKQLWKPGNMLYPLPAVLISCGDRKGRFNIMTAAWTGTICTDPPMLYVSIRKSRYSYNIIKDTGEFFANIATQELAFAADWCGVKSGRYVDKFKETGLTPEMGCLEYAPMIDESPVCIACKVARVEELGSHDMFMANVRGVYADERYMDGSGKFDLSAARPIVYSHGEYYGLGPDLGHFGFSVKKKKKNRKSGDASEE